jgi:class 3 adenylate cyclase
LNPAEKHRFAAEIYKTFLHCAAKIIRSEDGVITAYDGDRIMAVFIGNAKNTSAVRAALKNSLGGTEHHQSGSG